MYKMAQSLFNYNFLLFYLKTPKFYRPFNHVSALIFLGFNISLLINIGEMLILRISALIDLPL